MLKLQDSRLAFKKFVDHGKDAIFSVGMVMQVRSRTARAFERFSWHDVDAHRYGAALPSKLFSLRKNQTLTKRAAFLVIGFINPSYRRISKLSLD